MMAGKYDSLCRGIDERRIVEEAVRLLTDETGYAPRIVQDEAWVPSEAAQRSAARESAQSQGSILRVQMQGVYCMDKLVTCECLLECTPGSEKLGRVVVFLADGSTGNFKR